MGNALFPLLIYDGILPFYKRYDQSFSKRFNASHSALLSKRKDLSDNKPMAFVPLHVYSGFSYLQSGIPVGKLPLLAKKLGYSRIGLCDNGTLSGLAPFYHAALKADITPIYGMDYRCPEASFSLFVLNEEGYRNLLYLAKRVSEGSATLSDLKERQTGLAKVFVVEERIADEEEFAKKIFPLLKGIDILWLGLPYGLDEETKISIRSFALNHSYPLIAFPKISYPKKEDAIVLDIVTAILEKGHLEHDKKDGHEHFLSPEEISAYYSEEEIRQTERLANLISFSLIHKRGGLLHFHNSLGLSSDEYLRKCTFEGLERKGLSSKEEYVKRVEYELGIIAKMGYSDYFLIVADYVRFAKHNGVMVGPGRGSAGGSLVSFALDIVMADPLRYGLLFERFLNPERLSMPDIDVDFADTSREKVIRYLQEKYGKERTGHVLTTQVIGAKEALRDIGRVYNFKQNEIELVISCIMNDRLSLRDDYRTSKKFRDLVDSDPYFLRFVSLASKIEGLPRQAGLHAAGIVLNDTPLSEAAPVSVSPEVGYVCCIEKDYLEEQGFLKMDLLGLTNLSTIERCLSLIKRSKGIDIDYLSLPHDDPKAISLIANGQTMGLFQLESAGMKKAIRQVGPTSFEDVAALLALFRPGPMESIPAYARRKKGLEKVAYLSPELEPILKETYGIIVYQEQIMQIARESAGMSYGEADLFRRAISKKKADKLLALRSSFIDGCRKNGHTEKISNALYALIERFANYGFNKSHAVSYAVLTCQMAYLKASYPEEFYSAILGSLSPSEAKFKNTLSEIKKRGLSLALPDVNRSEETFSLDEGKIRFPLSSIKGMPGNFASRLLDERRQNGPFTDVFDFASRMKKDGLNKQILTRLIDSGSFDALYKNRNGLRAAIHSILSYADMACGENGESILLDLDLEKPVIIDVPQNKALDLSNEYETLGLMVSGSPLSFYRDEIALKGAIPLSEAMSQNKEVLTYGIIKSCRAITTRNGKKMAFLDVYDEYSEMSSVVFNDAYSEYFPLLVNDALVYLWVKKDERKEGSYIVSKIESIGGNI